MLSNLASTFVLSLGLLSTASAAAIEARQADADSWRIASFDASCSNGLCRYYYELTSLGTDGQPGFRAVCQAEGIQRNDKTLRDCTFPGSKPGEVTSAQAYVQLRPRAPQEQTEFKARVGYSSGSGTVYYEATKWNTYSGWRDQSVSGTFHGVFDVYPQQSAATG